MPQRVYNVTVYTWVKLNFILEKQPSAVGVTPHTQGQYTLCLQRGLKASSFALSPTRQGDIEGRTEGSLKGTVTLKLSYSDLETVLFRRLEKD